MYQRIKSRIKQIKNERPLVLNITNTVTVDFIANGLLSLGGSPIVTQSTQESEDLLKLAKAVVINIGTLDDSFIALCEHVCEFANAVNIPIILDPVGAGASRYRTQTCLSLLKKFRFSVIRGNASEIGALSGLAFASKGVDSAVATEAVLAEGANLSRMNNCALVISGETDAVIAGPTVRRFTRGHAVMTSITGSGCLLSAVVAAFNAVHSNAFEAAEEAVLFYGVCGELAAAQSPSPGSFKAAFLDALSLLPEACDYE